MQTRSLCYLKDWISSDTFLININQSFIDLIHIISKCTEILALNVL